MGVLNSCEKLLTKSVRRSSMPASSAAVRFTLSANARTSDGYRPRPRSMRASKFPAATSFSTSAMR